MHAELVFSQDWRPAASIDSIIRRCASLQKRGLHLGKDPSPVESRQTNLLTNVGARVKRENPPNAGFLASRTLMKEKHKKKG
jgi:hypothetical protein